MSVQELLNFSIAVKYKNIFFKILFLKTHWYGGRMAVLGLGYLSQHV